MIDRNLTPYLVRSADELPVVTLTGPRQSGKTTLCRACFPNHPYVNLEVPSDRSHALEDPRDFLVRFPDGAVIDEVQRCPDLLSYIQSIVDDDPRPGRWILTGSQNLLLLESVSQTLAGRTAVLNLLPLSLDEMMRFPSPPESLDELLLTGGYPRIPDRGIDPGGFLDSYIATYLERDVRSVRRIGDLASFQRFMTLAAGRTGQLLNMSSLGSDVGVEQPTIREWLSVLEACFIAVRLPAWHANLRKRLVKAPKLHFLDTGLLCRLLGIRDRGQLAVHPLRGQIFESWVVGESYKAALHGGRRADLFHLRNQHGVEVDLVERTPQGWRLTEVKAGRTVTSDMMKNLKTMSGLVEETGEVELRVVYGGDEQFDRSGCAIVPWSRLHESD